jgi:hypothetical protein
MDKSTDKREHGWYITANIGDDSFYGDDNRIAWGKSRRGEPATFPLELHVPFDYSSPESALTVVSYVQWLEEQVEHEVQLRTDREDAAQD